MSLNHKDLIHLAQILGYGSLCDKGLCHGFSVMLGHAILNQDEATFFDRLELIETYVEDFHQLKTEIDNIKRQITRKQKVTEKEMQLLEIEAFFDGIVLSQSPLEKRDVFNRKYVFQRSFESIYPFIASQQLENTKTAVSIVASNSYAFDRDESNAYFTDLTHTLSQSGSITPIFLHNGSHVVFLNYNQKKQKWTYVDTNLLVYSKYKQGKHYLELEVDELTEKLFHSLASPTADSIVFNLTAIANEIHDNDKDRFNALILKHTKMPEHALRHNQQGYGLLYMACDDGNVDVVKALVQQPEININQATDAGITPLFLACYLGNVDAVKELLRHSMLDVNQGDVFGETPLSIACVMDHVEVVKALLQHSDLDVNHIDNSGETPLSIACVMGHVAVIRELIQHAKIDINQVVMASRQTVLYTACKEGNVGVVKELLRHADIAVNQVNQFGETSLSIACQKSHILVIKELVQHPMLDINQVVGTSRETLLYKACKEGNIRVVNELLQHPDIAVNEVNGFGETPLSIAYKKGHTSVIKALVQHAKLNINQVVGASAETLLYTACKEGNVGVVKELLRHSEIDINKGNIWGETSLFAIQHYAPEKTKAIILLYLNIKQLESHGRFLLAHDKEKGESAVLLAQKLYQKTDEFVSSSNPNNDFKQFTVDFKALLNSHQLMTKHRTLWKPILANILLALTGIGLLAIALKAGMSLLESSEKSLNKYLFFGKTTSEHHVDTIKNTLNLATPVANS